VSIQAFDPEAPEQLVGDPIPITSATTGTDGRFALDGFAAGRSYQLTATPADDTILSGTLEVSAPANAADMTLGKGGRIDATLVIASGTNDPRFADWPGVGVQSLVGGVFQPQLDADADRVVAGNVASFKRLPPGTYRVFVHAFVFNEVASDSIVIGPEGGTSSVSLTLETGRTIQGHVVDGTGAPVPRARIGRASGGAMMVMIVEADGSFEIPSFPNGASQILVSATGFADQTFSVAAGVTDLGNLVLVPAPNGSQGKVPSGR